MSKVKIQGHASGTGVLTVTAPNTDTNRTITLPDGTGTLLTTDGDGSSLTSLPNGSQLDHSGTKKFEATASGVTLTGTTGTSPLLELNNADAEDNDTGRESSLRFTGKRSGGEAVTNAQISGHHDGSADDDKGMMLFYTNGGSGSVQQLKLTSDGRGLSQFTAKAWLNMNGTGTIAIRDSHNVSSITDIGTGVYTVNFTTALANSDYSISGTSTEEDNGTPDPRSLILTNRSGAIRSTTAFQVHSVLIGSTAVNSQLYDASRVSAIVFGD